MYCLRNNIFSVVLKLFLSEMGFKALGDQAHSPDQGKLKTWKNGAKNGATLKSKQLITGDT